MKASTTEQFIEKANKIHNNKYDYAEVNYKSNIIKIKIICSEHGMFEQIPNSHLLGQGCSRCYGNKKSTAEEFITKANKVHNNKYDYSEINYKNNRTKINIICYKHGTFEQKPNDHLSGHGCIKCANDYLNKIKLSTTEEFIERANQIHNYRYDYSKINYLNAKTKVKIICKEHGEFEQKPKIHLNGSGCSKCNSSKGELQITKFLEQNNIKFEIQKMFDSCVYKSKLKFDFYLPEQKTLIEYDGEQHYGFGRFIDKTIPLRDEIKDVFAINNGYKMIRIPYTMFDSIEEILTEFIF
jgi:very-short-patch-repair endonuclease